MRDAVGFTRQLSREHTGRPVRRGGPGVPRPRGVRRPKHESARPDAGCFQPGPAYLCDILPRAVLGSSRIPDGSQRHRISSRPQCGSRRRQEGPARYGDCCEQPAAAAREQFGPQVAELDDAVASLRGTIAGLNSQDSASADLGKIAASVGVVEQAAKPIVDSVRTGCPAVPRVETPPAS